MQNIFDNDYSKLNSVAIEQQENSKVTLKEYGEAKQKFKVLEKKKQNLENELDFIYEQNREAFEKYTELCNVEEKTRDEFYKLNKDNYLEKIEKIKDKINEEELLTKKKNLIKECRDMLNNYCKTKNELEKLTEKRTRAKKECEEKMEEFHKKRNEFNEIYDEYDEAKQFYYKIYDEKLEKENEEFSQED